ncbi:hypothetical protein HID58_004487 [Brassica napus]|uniref:Uncharacterized protein n=1 Tax=Brassica napus TaxID=3708 RepID=A0ABQ8E8Q7_BRANA|nr:hypothetical protein HID58_004487 [Brassica napus]
MELRRARREVHGGESGRMYSGGIFREVEASADPPPPVRASGKRVFFRFVFAGFQLWRAEATKDPRFHLGSRCSLGKRFTRLVLVHGWCGCRHGGFGSRRMRSLWKMMPSGELEEISSFDGSLRCDDSAEKNGLRSLEACRVLSSDERGSLSVFVPVASRWRRLSRDGDDALSAKGADLPTCRASLLDALSMWGE